MRAVSYGRVSTEGQATEGVSLQAQQRKIALWCSANDFILAATYQDAGLSGTRADNRPGLQAALADVTTGGGVLVVYSLSRLARNVRDTLTIADRLDKAGADLASLSERVDTTSAAGKMVFRLLSVMAQFESDIIGERTKGAMEYKRSINQRVGAVPLGQKLALDGRTLVDDPTEAPAVEAIRELCAAGLGYRAIARELQERGIRTRSGGVIWAHRSIQVILDRIEPGRAPRPGAKKRAAPAGPAEAPGPKRRRKP